MDEDELHKAFTTSLALTVRSVALREAVALYVGTTRPTDEGTDSRDIQGTLVIADEFVSWLARTLKP